MPRPGWKRISNKTKPVYSDYADPVNRHRLLDWANETLSKLKSDKRHVRTAANKKKREDEITNADCRMTHSKKGKCVEEPSKIETNDVATYVSEIVTSKMERKVQRMAFDSIVTGDNQKKKASSKENSANTESKENGDSKYKLKAKHRHTMVSCIEDQEGDLYRHEESTEQKKKKKKKKYKESSHKDCSADTTSLTLPLVTWAPVMKERSRKKEKLIKHSKSDRADCYHCCKCASKEAETQKKEMNTNYHTNMFDGMKYLSGSGEVKKCKMNSDVYTGTKNESASFWEGAESSGHYKQGKKKRSKHASENVLEESEQLINEHVTKESSKEKKKEKRSYTHSFSEQSISKKKKLKKYKLCTQELTCDESMSASEHLYRMGVGVRCDLPSATEENQTFEVHCVTGKKSKKRKHRHEYWFNDKLEETKNETHSSCNTECASERSTQTNKEDFCCYTVEERKRKKRGKKLDVSSEIEIISEARDHSDIGPRKKKNRKKDEQNCKDNENTSNSEERDKQKLYSDRNNGNTVETSFMEETQRKKQKKSKSKIYNVSLDAKERNEEYRHKKDAVVGGNQMTNESMDHALLDYTSTSTLYSVKRKDKTGNKRKSETGGVESVNSKKNKALSAIPKEAQRITAATTHEVGYTELDLAPELTQTVNSLNEKNNDREVLTSIVVNTHKNSLHSRNIKQGRSIGNFGLSPIAMLLGTDLEFSNSKHSCPTCCRCKLHPKVRPCESSEIAAKDFSRIVIKTEPGLTTEQEKKIIANVDPHIMDKQTLNVIPDSQIELNTNDLNGTDGVKTTENSDAVIDKLDMQEHIVTDSGNGPNEYSTMDMHVGGADNDLGSVGCVEGFGDEDVVNGNEEVDINTPFYNIYDDKITVKEEILHLTNTHDDQNHGWDRAEDTSQENFKFVGKQDMAYVGNQIELPSETVLDETAADVARILKVEDLNGSDLNTVLQYEPVPLNEVQSKCDRNVIPEAANLHNITWNATAMGSLYWPSANGNQQQSSQFFDVTAITTGQVCFLHVPKWWRRGKIARVLRVPITAVYIHFNYYNPIVRKNYVTVNFFDNESLQNIVSHASRIHCSGWNVTSI